MNVLLPNMRVQRGPLGRLWHGRRGLSKLVSVVMLVGFTSAIQAAPHEPVAVITLDQPKTSPGHPIAVGLTVTNRAAETIVLIDPGTPNWVVDKKGCSLLMSSAVTNEYAYDFTPSLIRVEPGKTWSGRVEVKGDLLDGCTNCVFQAEVAYLTAEAAAGKLSREQAIKLQRLVRSRSLRS